MNNISDILDECEKIFFGDNVANDNTICDPSLD